MKKTTILMLALLLTCCLFNGCDETDPQKKGPEPVVKTNTMQVYMHYMPWFQSKPVSGYWGSHWKMANKNPDIVDENGKREIASHYYPIIGPYDSTDPDVIEYHLLLMKYSGVDGVLIDWYGSHTVNDYKVNLNGTNALIDKVDDVGLTFAVVYEDYTAEVVGSKTTKTPMQAAQSDMNYLANNYFSNEQYINIDNAPLLLTFGPRYFEQGSQWQEIFSVLNSKPKFLPLWNHGTLTGDQDDGEFAWVDFTDTYSDLDNFYNRAVHLDLAIGSAFPRFHDFYEQGGTGTSYGYVDYDNGETLRKTLAKAEQRKADFVQLVTWNDFGEGTVIEPTLENEFEPLQIIQEFTGVSYGLAELELVHSYYVKKKELKGNTEAEAKLGEVFAHLVNLRVSEATAIMNELP